MTITVDITKVPYDKLTVKADKPEELHEWLETWKQHHIPGAHTIELISPTKAVITPSI